MKKLLTLLLASLATTQVMATDHQVTCPLVVLSGTLSNRTLDRDTPYLLRNCVVVPSGVTITAEAGVVIMGEKSTNGSIIFRKGSEFISQGTSSDPVTFTSDQIHGYKAPGDWAGIVFEGYATNNQSNSITLEDRTCTINGGGTDDQDYSGVIKFLRVEYPVNGLTMVSVGDQTEFHDVMVSYASNDALELYGGTVPFKRFVSLNAFGNDIVARYGNRSMAQYIINLRPDANAHIATGNKSNSIIFSNDDAVSGPINHPRFSNVSIVGPYYCGSGLSSDFKYGVFYRGGTEGTIANSVIAGWDIGLFMDGTDVIANATDNGTLFFYENSMYANNTAQFDKSGTWSSLCATTQSNWMTGIGFCAQANNQLPVATLGYSASICGTYSSTPPTLLLGSNTLGSSDFPSGSDLDDAFFTSTSSKHGALNTSTDFTDGWAVWYPQGEEYCSQDANKSAHTTGVNNVNAATALTIAPNPVSGTTYAEFTSAQSGKVNITIVNSVGQSVRTISREVSKGKQKLAISTDGLSAGIYLINVELSKGNMVHARVLVK